VIDTDVVVVGGGLAGRVAALTAARRATVSVGLVSRSETTLSGASGLVDVLGYTPDGDGPLADPFAAIPELPEAHPYRVVGVDGVRDGLGLFDEAVGDAYSGERTDRNALVPTCWGRVKPTARYPAGVEAGVASQQRPTSLVGFEELTAVDAPLVADRLADWLPYRINGITFEFPAELDGDAGPVDATPVRMAHAFDAAETDEDGKTPVDRLVDRLGVYLDRKDRVGFPAVLGLERHDSVRAELADRLGLRVFEVPMGPPSVPGMRLEGLLADALADAGVRVETGTSVVGVESDGGHVDRLHLDGSEHDAWEASQFVLATGGVAGGGIRGDRRAVTEPVFGCHVETPTDPDEWGADAPLGDHPFARFGVTVDDELVPLADDDLGPTADDGSREFENLRAAGTVIGGYDFAAEKSGSGVSIATGYAAGAGAAGDVA
jgi:glycerol-3-phosphate dehydrogenase subunit B